MPLSKPGAPGGPGARRWRPRKCGDSAYPASSLRGHGKRSDAVRRRPHCPGRRRCARAGLRRGAPHPGPGVVREAPRGTRPPPLPRNAHLQLFSVSGASPAASPPTARRPSRASANRQALLPFSPCGNPDAQPRPETTSDNYQAPTHLTPTHRAKMKNVNPCSTPSPTVSWEKAGLPCLSLLPVAQPRGLTSGSSRCLPPSGPGETPGCAYLAGTLT